MPHSLRFAALAALILPITAQAHAILTDSAPKPGASVAAGRSTCAPAATAGSTGPDRG